MEESLVEQFNAIDAGETPAETPATEQPAAPVAETTETAAPELSPAEEGNDDRAKLVELAKKLGYELEEKKLGPQDYIRARQEKRRLKQEFAERQKALDEERGALGSKVERLSKALELYERGDIDDAVRSVFGVDLEALNSVEIEKAKGRDPSVRKLERELKELREQTAKREREAAERAEAERLTATREQNKRAYTERLSGALAKSEEFAPYASAPGFVEEIIRIQEAEWDEDEGTTIGADVAARSVLARMREQYETLSKLFGSQVSAKSESPIPAGKKPAPKITGKDAKTVASGPQQWRDDSEWLAWAKREAQEKGLM